jgi:hypothetical protein
MSVQDEIVERIKSNFRTAPKPAQPRPAQQPAEKQATTKTNQKE